MHVHVQTVQQTITILKINTELKHYFYIDKQT